MKMICMFRLFRLFFCLGLISYVSALNIQHIKTSCWIFTCYNQYDRHYNSVLIEINTNPGYLHHNTILYYNSLFTTIVYQ